MKILKRKTLKSTNGITLIALVITIIVLLILAGISISMLSSDNGILQKATTAKENSEKTQIEERIKLAYHAALAGGKGSYTKDTLMQELKNEFETDYDVDDSDNENWILYAQGQSVTIPAGKAIQKLNKVYTLGQEVIVGGENFYVITKNDNATKSNIRLLAKYNLNTEGTEQVENAKMSDTSCAFASNKYWSDTVDSYTDWDNKKLDINTVSGNIEGDAVTKAQEYAVSKGGDESIGKLLTYEEIEDLNNQGETMSNIIRGKANQQGASSSDYYLVYWVGSVIGPIPEQYNAISKDIWIWHGGGTPNFINTMAYYFPFGPGVRPAIEIEKSKISE